MKIFNFIKTIIRTLIAFFYVPYLRIKKKVHLSYGSKYNNKTSFEGLNKVGGEQISVAPSSAERPILGVIAI